MGKMKYGTDGTASWESCAALALTAFLPPLPHSTPASSVGFEEGIAGRAPHSPPSVRCAVAGPHVYFHLLQGKLLQCELATALVCGVAVQH